MLALTQPLVLDTLPALMVKVKAGSFEMGGEKYGWEKPIHRVTLTRDFALCRYPVTQALWAAVIKENPQPSRFKGSQRPVEQVSWYGAVEFCNRLSEKQGFDPCYEIRGEQVSWLPEANGYRLPTEAEWEYAAQGGRHGRGFEYAGSPDLGRVAWYNNNSSSNRETQPVGQKRPNELGLYDLSGNVWEWCWDWYDDYPSKKPQIDPVGPEYGSSRVSRGGGWISDSDSCWVVHRNGFYLPTDRHDRLGFRLARTL